jgi:hypothetical protein
VEILRELVARAYENLKADKAVQQGKHKDDVRWTIQKALKQGLAKVDEELKADGETCSQVGLFVKFGSSAC